jgi:beta-xylosidase
MKTHLLRVLELTCVIPLIGGQASAEPARNPVIWADVPDVAAIRVGDTYYMASTTMHLSPGLPIMKSKDLVHYSLDGMTWTRIGATLQMAYTLPHFMGYRFGLFNFATKTAGGFVDFDYYRVSDELILDPETLQFLYQGRDPASSGRYELLPYQLGLLRPDRSGR